MAVAIFLPALSGRARASREFLLANLIAFAIAAPLFALLPAVGPWYHGGFMPSPDQLSCQANLLALRLPGPYILTTQDAGVVCFPSFHVIWAILCAGALWTFRRLRVPVSILALLIVLSTMTTGWHYFSDVLAGIAIAALSIALARLMVTSRSH
jgi:membrane-associated phospholipid phosphatase